MEIWKDIKDFEGLYQVSNYGRIKSLPRELPTPNGFFYTSKEKIRKCHIRNNGRQSNLIVNLPTYKDLDGKWHIKNFLVSRLVAEAFLGFDRNSKLNVIHIDGNTMNNNVMNLKIGTPKEKTRQALKNGFFDNLWVEKRMKTLSQISKEEKKERLVLRRKKQIDKLDETKKGIKKRNNKYEVYAFVNKKWTYFGSKKTLAEAIEMKKNILKKEIKQ